MCSAVEQLREHGGCPTPDVLGSRAIKGTRGGVRVIRSIFALPFLILIHNRYGVGNNV